MKLELEERTQNEKTDHCTVTQRGPSIRDSEVGLPQDAARRTEGEVRRETPRLEATRPRE